MDRHGYQRRLLRSRCLTYIWPIVYRPTLASHNVENGILESNDRRKKELVAYKQWLLVQGFHSSIPFSIASHTEHLIFILRHFTLGNNSNHNRRKQWSTKKRTCCVQKNSFEICRCCSFKVSKFGLPVTPNDLLNKRDLCIDKSRPLGWFNWNKRGFICVLTTYPRRQKIDSFSDICWILWLEAL